MSCDANAFYKLALKEWQEIHHGLALNYITEAIKCMPDNIDFYRIRAAIRMEMFRAVDAIEDYTFIIENNEDKDEVYNTLLDRALAFDAMGDYEAAIKDLNLQKSFNEEADESPSTRHSTLGWRVKMLEKLHQHLEIINEINAWAERQALNEDLYYARAKAKFELKRYAEAKEDLVKTLQLVTPDTSLNKPRYHALLGHIYLGLAQSTEALIEFNTALALLNSPPMANVDEYKDRLRPNEDYRY